ncbi:hypothetical protein H2248_003460 [Termitomyces sp. 'cryptogamus']|nr:hypothetical protein H2248_003460 [Termitomyces sp. 'cryptogamus']
MSWMAPVSPLDLLLRALHSTITKRLIRGCRYSWTILWRFLQRCIAFLYRRQRSVSLPPQNLSNETDEGNAQQLSKAEVGPSDTQVLASLLPIVRPKSQQSGWCSVSHQMIAIPSSTISLKISTPSDVSQSEQRSFRGDSMTTVHSVNTMSSQIDKVLPLDSNGSRASVVPASPFLQPIGDVVGPGTSDTAGYNLCEAFSDNIYPLLPTKVPRYKRE